MVTVDLRSDTVTRPSAEMRRAMAEAEVGDDVFGEDPTTRALQDTIADLLGKEAALFIPSGMMGNQLGIHTQTNPGDEVIVEHKSHIFNYESGAASSLCGVTLHVIHGENGRFNREQFMSALRHGAYWESNSSLLCLENTLNIAGGLLYPIEELKRLAECAHDHGLSCHLDGARLWNASVVTGIAMNEFAAPFDTVTVCLSKGLGAPVGSVLASTEQIIQKAHRRRKELGAGMRQSGILAAAGLYAIEHHLADLKQDHFHAQRLAEGLQQIHSLHVLHPETNIVLIHLLEPSISTDTLLKRIQAQGTAMVAVGSNTIRATVHRDISTTDIDTAIQAVEYALSAP
ncbi:MAG: beta-eliminating lyase-related protein [Bacteroidetes bacterium]|nr:beta-eliminating lyase-related protein [Bacteroidota bacterium]MCY4205517.1 beta-eliminating lyase-related protein [Bacteroidota bacterium]